MAKPNIGDLIPVGAIGNVKNFQVLQGKTYSSNEGVDLLGTMDLTPSKLPYGISVSGIEGNYIPILDRHTFRLSRTIPINLPPGETEVYDLFSNDVFHVIYNMEVGRITINDPSGRGLGTQGYHLVSSLDGDWSRFSSISMSSGSSELSVSIGGMVGDSMKIKIRNKSSDRTFVEIDIDRTYIRTIGIAK